MTAKHSALHLIHPAFCNFHLSKWTKAKRMFYKYPIKERWQKVFLTTKKTPGYRCLLIKQSTKLNFLVKAGAHSLNDCDAMLCPKPKTRLPSPLQMGKTHIHRVLCLKRYGTKSLSCRKRNFLWFKYALRIFGN